ncbi:hypothetical protein ABW20_dc0105707 [Dactylellina cionopaga]|nr:hypothetical protein ABW20_dc0105707 [Dactylellina cionopaga]
MALGNLKSLKLMVGEFDESHQGHSKRSIELNTKFGEWLEAIGLNLEEFGLQRGACDEDVRGMSHFHIKRGLPRLERLSLKYIAMYSSNFEQFLEKCKAELQEVSIKSCSLEQECHPTTRWYRLLQYLNGSCYRLQQLYLDTVYDDRDEVIDDTGKPDFVLPLLQVKTTDDSIFSECDWHVSFPPPDGIPYETFQSVGKALQLHLTSEGFWDSISDRKWSYVQNEATCANIQAKFGTTFQ